MAVLIMKSAQGTLPWDFFEWMPIHANAVDNVALMGFSSKCGAARIPNRAHYVSKESKRDEDREVG